MHNFSCREARCGARQVLQDCVELMFTHTGKHSGIVCDVEFLQMNSVHVRFNEDLKPEEICILII